MNTFLQLRVKHHRLASVNSLVYELKNNRKKHTLGYFVAYGSPAWNNFQRSATLYVLLYLPKIITMFYIPHATLEVDLNTSVASLFVQKSCLCLCVAIGYLASYETTHNDISLHNVIKYLTTHSTSPTRDEVCFFPSSIWMGLYDLPDRIWQKWGFRIPKARS